MIPGTFGIAEADLARDLAQRWEITLAAAAGVVTLPTVEAGALDLVVTYDATRSPRAEVDLSLEVDPLLLSTLEVEILRAGRLELRAGYGSSSPLVLMGRFPYRNARYRHGRLELRASSAESLLLDVAEQGAPLTVNAGRSATVLTNLVAGAGTVAALLNPEALTGAQLEPAPITDLWDAAATIAAAEGWRLYGPPREPDSAADRDLEIRRGPSGAEPVAATLRTGDLGTVVDVERADDRDGAATEVEVRFEWTDEAGLDQVVTATATDPGIAAGTLERIRAVYRYAYPATQYQATACAQSFLARARARAVSYRVTAINAFWLRPDARVLVESPIDGVLADQLIDRVAFSSSGLMDVTTRSIPAGWTLAALAATHTNLNAVRLAYPNLAALAAGPS